MDIIPRQINALLVELKKIREHLNGLRDDYKEQSAANRQTYEGSREHQCKLPIPLEVKLEENQAREYKTSNDQHQTTQESIRTAAWAAFVAASIYAAVTLGIGIVNFFQLREIKNQTPSIQGSADSAKESVEAIKKQMRQQERPWIYITVQRVHVVTITKPRTPVFADVQIENLGLTPAETIHGCFVFDIVRRGEDPQFSCTTQHQPDERWQHVKFSTGSMFKGDKQTFPVYMFTTTPRIGATGREAAKALIDKPTQRAVHDGDSFAVVSGRIEYGDVFGMQHWTQFCKAASNCAKCGEPIEAPEHPELVCFAYNQVDGN